MVSVRLLFSAEPGSLPLVPVSVLSNDPNEALDVDVVPWLERGNSGARGFHEIK